MCNCPPIRYATHTKFGLTTFAAQQTNCKLMQLHIRPYQIRNAQNTRKLRQPHIHPYQKAMCRIHANHECEKACVGPLMRACLRQLDPIGMLLGLLRVPLRRLPIVVAGPALLLVAPIGRHLFADRTKFRLHCAGRLGLCLALWAALCLRCCLLGFRTHPLLPWRHLRTPLRTLGRGSSAGLSLARRRRT